MHMSISLTIIEHHTASETETLEKDITVSILTYLHFSEADL